MAKYRNNTRSGLGLNVEVKNAAGKTSYKRLSLAPGKTSDDIKLAQTAVTKALLKSGALSEAKAAAPAESKADDSKKPNSPQS